MFQHKQYYNTDCKDTSWRVQFTVIQYCICHAWATAITDKPRTTPVSVTNCNVTGVMSIKMHKTDYMWLYQLRWCMFIPFLNHSVKVRWWHRGFGLASEEIQNISCTPWHSHVTVDGFGPVTDRNVQTIRLYCSLALAHSMRYAGKIAGFMTNIICGTTEWKRLPYHATAYKFISMQGLIIG